MEWISKTHDSKRHHTDGARERVQVEGGFWRFRARTLCGRTITGFSGQTSIPVDCSRCAKAVR